MVAMTTPVAKRLPRNPLRATEKSGPGWGIYLGNFRNHGDAKAAYTQASQYSTIYYGQLAREKIGLGKVPEEVDSGVASRAAEAKADKDEVVRAPALQAVMGKVQTVLTDELDPDYPIAALNDIVHAARAGCRRALHRKKRLGQRNRDLAWIERRDSAVAANDAVLGERGRARFVHAAGRGRLRHAGKGGLRDRF